MGNNCCIITQPQSRKPQFASCPRYSAVNQSPIIGRIVTRAGVDEQVTEKQPETKWSNGGLYQAVTAASDGAVDDNAALSSTNQCIESQSSRVESQLADSVDGGSVRKQLLCPSKSKKCEEVVQRGEVVLDRVSRSQEELDNLKVSCSTSDGGEQSKSLSSLRRLENTENSASPRHSSTSALRADSNRSIKEGKVEQSIAMFSSGHSSELLASQHLEQSPKNSTLSDPLRKHEALTVAPLTNPSKEVRRNSSSVSSCHKDGSSLNRSATPKTSTAKRSSTRLSHRLSAAALAESGTDSAAFESGIESFAPECSTVIARQSPVTIKPRASFRLVRDLEVPDPDVAPSKDLKQLIEAFVRDNSLMRKPCKEFLDRASYRRAKLEHHLSLVSTVKGVDVCSLSCASVTSSRTVNEQSTLELQGTPPKSARRLSAKKNLNFDQMSRSSARPKSASSNRSDSTRVELFSLEDFLETASEDQKDSDAERSSNLGGAAALAVGTNSHPHALDESFSSSGFRNSSPRKSSNSPRNSSSLPMSKDWDIDQVFESDDRGLKKQDSLAKEEGSSFKEPSYVNGWDDPADFRSDSSGIIGKEDKENSPPNVLNASKFTKSAGNFEDSFDGGNNNNEVLFRSSRRSRSSASSLKESSPLSKINTLNVIDNFPSFECEDQYNNSKERNYSTPKKKKTEAVSAYESPSRDGLDDDFSVFNSGLNASKVSNGSYKAKSTFKNDSFSNNIADDDTFSKADTYNGFDNGFDVKSKDDEWPKLQGSNENFKSSFTCVAESADPDPVCSEFSLFGEEDRESTSRLNASSSSQRSLRRPSPAFGRPFATLSGISPTYKKRNSFKFDEDPRFGCNTSRNSDNCQSDYDMQDKLGIGSKAEDELGSPERGKRSRRVHTANDSQDFGNDDLFGFPPDNDETLDDPFSTSADQDASLGRDNKEDGGDQQDTDEGPSIRLNKHVKISKKGISLGAMGCELSIGKNVELNIFGKKTATLV